MCVAGVSMPSTVAPAWASARANSRWWRGKKGSTNTTFMSGMVTRPEAGDSGRTPGANESLHLLTFERACLAETLLLRALAAEPAAP